MTWMIEYFKTAAHIKSLRTVTCGAPSKYKNEAIIDLDMSHCKNINLTPQNSVTKGTRYNENSKNFKKFLKNLKKKLKTF